MAKLKAFKYSITPEVTAQYDEMGRAGIYALNELNQYMQTAKKAKSTADHHVYTHAKSGLTMYLQRKYNVIDRIELTEQPFAKTVKIAPHAIQRTVERLGQSEENANRYIRQLLAAATYHGEGLTRQGNRAETYLHKKTGTTIVVAKDNDTVITVYRAEEPAPSIAKITIDRIANAVQREFKRMQTQLNREVRKLSEQQAQLNVQLAELSLNKIRCYHPPTQALIQSRIDAIKTQVSELATEIDVKLTQIQQAESEVKAIIE